MILLDTQKEEFSKLREIKIFDKVSNEERFNRDLLYIGLGGVGARVVTNLKIMLKEHITPEDNINFLMIDSDIPFMEQSIEDSKEDKGLNALEIISIYRPNLETLLSEENIPETRSNYAKWMREDFPRLSIGTDGAGGNRQVGRLMFSNAYEDMRILLFEKLEEIYTKSEAGKLDVIVISGLGGGTGSGILSDLTYNIKAFGKAKKWKNYRVAGCVIMPDVLFANREINQDKRNLLNANAYAALKEIEHFMKLPELDEFYSFESTTHRLNMKDKIFDVCMLVSGKKDEQGYLPEETVLMDTAFFLFKLAINKFIGGKEDKTMLRDAFFDNGGRAMYKVINESVYKIPIRELENISEYSVFSEAYKRIHTIPDVDDIIEKTGQNTFGEVQDFLNGKPGDEINLKITGLIMTRQFEKPVYKMIKKGQDGLRESMARKLNDFKQDIAVVIKSFKNKFCASLDEMIAGYMKEYGPFATMELIGAGGLREMENDGGLIAKIKSMEQQQRAYQPSGEYSRIIDSIKDMVAKRFFTFPNAKRETENGYYDACIKETLATERNIIMEGLDAHDVFGDAIRLLRQKAERINDIYSQFDEDLKNSVEDLALEGKKVTSYLMKEARQGEFLPVDYITESKIEECRQGIIRLMVENETNIDTGRLVPVKQEMEKIYRNILIGIGVYAPEKMILTAFSDKKPTLQEANVMFVSATNGRRDEIMGRAARAFVEGTREKISKKKLCIMKEGFDAGTLNKRYISLPEAMPYFSQAVKDIFMQEPYNEKEEDITFNPGELEISIDDMYNNVALRLLECVDDMHSAYSRADSEIYYGLHIDETMRNMREYPDIA